MPFAAMLRSVKNWRLICFQCIVEKLWGGTEVKFKSRRATFAAPDNTQYRYRDGSVVDASVGYHPHRSTRFRNWGVEVASAVAARQLPELYRDRSECCGCTACEFVCPKSAISMEPDEEGFLYPVVNAGACVRCDRCESACAFKAVLVDRWEP